MKKATIFILVLAFILLLIIIGMSFPRLTGNITKMSNPKVLIKTTEGNIELTLYKDKAPITVENFLSYVKDKSYDGTVFHRVIKGFMVQGGGFTPDGKQKQTKSPIILESNKGLSNKVGTVAMARTMNPDSATNQFFINTADNTFLDYGARDKGYAVFGEVTKGMDIIKKIEAKKTSTKNGMTDWPLEDIKIISIELL